MEIERVNREKEERDRETRSIINAVQKAKEKIGEGKRGEEFVGDGRHVKFEEGGICDKVEIKHILEYAQRLPKLIPSFHSQDINWNGSILNNKFECMIGRFLIICNSG